MTKTIQKIHEENEVFRDLVSKLIKNGTPFDRLYIINNIKEIEEIAREFLQFETFEEAYISTKLIFEMNK